MPRESKVFGQLRELSRIVSAAGPKESSMLSLNAIEKSKKIYARLFRSMRGDMQVTESGIFRSLFDTQPAGIPPDSLSQRQREVRYRKVKSKLKLRLLNTLFVLNLGEAGFSEYSQMLFRTNRAVFFSRVLLMLGAGSFSTSIAKKGLAEAMTIEEWACAMEFLAILRFDAAVRGDDKSHKVYLSQYEYCQKLLAAEQRAEVCVEGLQIAFAKSGGEHPSHAMEAEKAAGDVNELVVAYPSFKLGFISIRLRALATQIRMDYRATEALCEEAFVLLDRYPQFRNRARTSEYAIMGLVSAVQLRDHSKVSRWLVQCGRDITPKEENWFAVKEFHYLHSMHSLWFQEAHEIVREVLANARYDTQTEALRDRWNLFRLYAEFAIGVRVPITKNEDFNVLVHSYTADKTGLNTAMIILHVLLLAERRQFGELRDRFEFIRGYRKRHLKGPENSQLNRLFKMLELIETCDLDYNKIVRKSRGLLAELKQSEETEPIQGEQILPTTWIWDHLMKQLQEYRPLNARIRKRNLAASKRLD